MNRNRHGLSYRRRGGDPRPWQIAWIVTLALLVVLLAVFLTVGNILAAKRRGEQAVSEPPVSEQGEDTTPQKAEVPSVSGFPVLLETADSTTFASRIQALSGAGRTAASIPLTDRTGALLYRSPVGDSLGVPVLGEPSVDPFTALSSVEGSTVRTSGVLYLNAFQNESPSLRAVELARVSALAAELFEAGIDELLIVAPHMTASHVDEILRFVDDILHLSPNACVGIALTDAILDSESAAQLLDQLYNGVSFLAYNLSDPDETDAVSFVSDRVTNPGMRYNLLRYRMRILLPYSEDESVRSSVISAVEAENLTNWQMLLY